MNNITYDSTSFIINGKKVFLYSGEIHYFRINPQEWRRRLLLAGQAGLNTVSTYIPWNFYEPEKGNFLDWKGQRDLRGFVQLCGQMGFWVILRPGPFIHAEWRHGGLPDWLLAEGITVVNRANQPSYLAAVRRWFEAVFSQVRDLQITHGGPIILVQVDNEYGQDWNGKYGGLEYLNNLKEMMRDLGVDVPLIEMNEVKEAWPLENFIHVVGAYPLNSWSGRQKFHPLSLSPSPIRDIQPSQPLFAIEAGGGMYVARNSPNKPVIPSHLTEYIFWSFVGQGGGGINWYVFSGGTNPPGFQEVEGALSWETGRSYDFQAAIREYGQLHPRFGIAKRLGWFIHSFNEFFAASQPAEGAIGSIAPAGLEAAVRSDGKSALVILRNYDTELPRESTDATKVVADNYARRHRGKLKNVRVSLKKPDGGQLSFPQFVSYDISENRTVGLPVEMSLPSGLTLAYATAEILSVKHWMVRNLVLLYSDSGQPVEVALRVPSSVAHELVGETECLSENSLRVFKMNPGNLSTILLNTDPITQITLLTRWQAENVWQVGRAVAIFAFPLIDNRYEATAPPDSHITEPLVLFLPEIPGELPEGCSWNEQLHTCTLPVNISFPAIKPTIQQHREGDWQITELLFQPNDFKDIDDILIRVRSSSQEAYAYVNDVWVSESFIPDPLYSWEFKVLQAARAESKQGSVKVVLKSREAEVFEVQALCVVSGSCFQSDDSEGVCSW